MKMSSKKITAIIASVVLACGATVGGTIAWLAVSTNPVTNTFTPGEIKGTIEEHKPTPDDNVKRNVFIENTGKNEAYVRVMLTPCWMIGDDVAGVSVDNTFTIEYGTSSKWKKGTDGFWYYTESIDVGESTDPLIEEAYPNSNLGDKYSGLSFRLDVSAQLIQATPAEAVENSWDVTVNKDGTLTIN